MATLRLKERERARPRVFLSESEKVVSVKVSQSGMKIADLVRGL